MKRARMRVSGRRFEYLAGEKLERSNNEKKVTEKLAPSFFFRHFTENESLT